MKVLTIPENPAQTLVQDAAEGRGGRADEQRAAAQRENGDAGRASA